MNWEIKDLETNRRLTVRTGKWSIRTGERRWILRGNCWGLAGFLRGRIPQTAVFVKRRGRTNEEKTRGLWEWNGWGEGRFVFVRIVVKFVNGIIIALLGTFIYFCYISQILGFSLDFFTPIKTQPIFQFNYKYFSLQKLQMQFEKEGLAGSGDRRRTTAAASGMRMGKLRKFTAIVE